MMLLPIWWSRSKWGDSAGRALHLSPDFSQVVYQRLCFNVPETHGLGCIAVNNNKEKPFSTSVFFPHWSKDKSMYCKIFVWQKSRGKKGREDHTVPTCGQHAAACLQCQPLLTVCQVPSPPHFRWNQHVSREVGCRHTASYCSETLPQMEACGRP